MAEFVIKSSKLYFDGYEFSPQHMSAQLTLGREAPDRTKWGNNSRIVADLGLKTAQLTAAGHFDAGVGTVDEQYQAAIGTADKVLSISQPGAAVGDIAYVLRSLIGEYVPLSGNVGDILGFTISGMATDDVFRGTVMYTDTLTTTQTSASRQLGTVPAGSRVFAAYHITAASGTPTLDIVVRSDDDSGMATPTTQITFAQATAIGAAYASADGEILDDWWDVQLTVGGSTPSFTVVVIVGIQKK